MKKPPIKTNPIRQHNFINTVNINPSADINYGLNRNFILPKKYDDNKIVLMVCDPWLLHTYWETREDVELEIRKKIRERQLAGSKRILRVYEIKGNSSEAAFDIELNRKTDNWYISVGFAGKKWVVEIGMLCSTGEFFSIAKSNVVTTPPGKRADYVGGSMDFVPRMLRKHKE